MRRRSAVLGGVLGTTVLGAGYLTLDVYDVVPGALTRDRPTVMELARSPDSGERSDLAVPEPPRVSAQPSGPLRTPASAGNTPTRAGVEAALQDPLDSRWLGPRQRVGLTVRDAVTGQGLYAQHADLPLTPASTTKLLSAAAVAASLDLQAPLDTTVVAGSTPQEIVLVAGGDTLLAPGRGDPTAVSGRAGLADLAREVAASLQDRTVDGPVTLRVDPSYAPGPLYAPGWSDAVIDRGYTGPIAMLGLSTQRPRPDHPAPPDPVQQTAQAFREALTGAGVTVADGRIAEVVAPEGADVLGAVASAPVRQVLALALEESDNALTESLARQGAFHAGAATDHAGVTAWIVEEVEALGVDVTGVEVADASGLADGSLIPVRALGELMVQATGNRNPALQTALAGLPVGGLSGTLHDRFHLENAAAGVGLARAKTGSLPGVTSVAGTVVNADGRLLVYAVIADDILPGPGVLEGRAALDAIVAALAECGCS